jgi:glutamate racemase
LVEEGWLSHPITRDVAKEYLTLLKGKIDTLILGCTHYPFISQVIKEVIGDEVKMVTSSEATAEVCWQHLNEKDMLSNIGGKILFYTTDEPCSFIEIASSFLQIDIEAVERVEIER